MPMQYPDRPEIRVELALVGEPLGDEPAGDNQVSIGGGTLPVGWTDITSYTREITIDRGRSSDLGRVETGTASIILDNRDRRFDPIYEDGPYWDSGSVPARTNLLKNPNFQYGVGNWFAPSNVLTPVSAAGFRRGGGAQIQMPTPVFQQVRASNHTSANGTTTSRTAVEAGSFYSFQIFFNADAPLNFGYISTPSPRLDWFNSAGTLISTSIGSPDIGPYFGPGLWPYMSNEKTRAEVSAVAPANAVSVVPYIQIPPHHFFGVTLTFQLDYALFEEVDALHEYRGFFDGDDAGCFWLGTPGDSQSVRSTGPVNYAPIPSVNSLDAMTELSRASASIPAYTTEFLPFEPYPDLVSNYSLAFVSEDVSVTGTKSIEIFYPIGTSAGTTNYVYLGDAIPCLLEETLTIRLAVYVPAGGSPTSVSLSLHYADNDGVNTGISYPAGNLSFTESQWTYNEFVVPPFTLYSPEDCGIVKFNVRLATQGVGYFYLDQIQMFYGDGPQPWFDGDTAGYEWHGDRGNSASQEIIRQAGTLLKPRRQIQIHAVFPNDSVAEQECFDLVSGNLFSLPPGIYGEFSRDGLTVSDYFGSASTGQVLLQQFAIFSTTEVSIYFQIKPYQAGGWSNMSAGFWAMGTDGANAPDSNTLACALSDGKLRVYINSASVQDWTLVWEDDLPTNMRFDTPDSHWFKVNVTRTPFGLMDFTLATRVFATVGQTPVPTTLQEIGSVQTLTAAGNIISPLSFNSVQCGFSSSQSSSPIPLTESRDNNFHLMRFVLDDEVTEQRKVDLLFDTYHSLFRGFTQGWRQKYDMKGKDATVPLECFDLLGIAGGMVLPPDYITEWVQDRGAWGYWKLGDAGDFATDFSGGDHHLRFNSGARLPSTFGPLAPALSGLPSSFKISDTPASGTTVSGLTMVTASGATAPLAAKFLISNIYGGHKYANDLSGTAKFSVSFWMRSTIPAGSAGDLVPMFHMGDAAALSTAGFPAGPFLEIGIRRGTGGIGGTAYFKALNMTMPLASPPVGSVSTTHDTTTVITDGLPHMITVTVGGDFSYIYVDGYAVQTGFGRASNQGVLNGGKIQIGGDQATTTTNLQFTGDLQDAIYFPEYELTALEVLELYNLSSGFLEETTAQRTNRLMNLADIPQYLRAVDPQVSGDCGTLIGGSDSSVLEALHEVEDTEAGIVFADRDGRLSTRGRYFMSTNDLGVNAQAEFDDQGSGIGFHNLEFHFDAEQLMNSHTVVDDSEQESEIEDADSVREYGRRSRTVNTLLPSSEDALQMARGLTMIYKDPLLRAEPFDITPIGAEWLEILPLDIGVRFSLSATPMGVGDPIVQDLALQRIAYDLRPKDFRVQITGSARPVRSFFRLDESVLDGEDILGF